MYNSLEKKILKSSLIKTEDILGVEKRTLQNKMQSLVSNGKVVKIKNGLYAMVNPLDNDIYANKFEIATSMYEDAYIVYHTALEYYGLSNQIYNLVQVATKHIERKREFRGYTFEFHDLKTQKYVDDIYQNSLIRVTSIERTIVDCLNRIRMAGGIEEVSMAIRSITYIDEKKLLDVLETYNLNKLYNKVGYVLSEINSSLVSKDFLNICKERLSKKIVDMRENKKLSSTINKEWNIIVPKYIINEEY